MSKAFTKDDDAADGVFIVPRRRPLPLGTPNYVTPRGLRLLQAELAELLSAAPSQGETERERAWSARAHRARVAELEARLQSAVLVRSEQQPKSEVRFGASVSVLGESGAERTYRIVGVDEADAEQGLLAFVSPLARALLGKRRGDVALVAAPTGGEELEITSIAYD